MTDNTSIKLRPANIEDTDTILRLIQELADYEKAPQEVVATAANLKESLFIETPHAHVLLAETNNQTIGYAIYFFSYSTWLGKQGIYLEDLYVTPTARGCGAGKKLLRAVAQIAVSHGCGRLEWSVLDWNQSAIDFYESFNAKAKDEWTVYRLDKKALTDFANGEL